MPFDPVFQITSLGSLRCRELEPGSFLPGSAQPVWTLTYVECGLLHSVVDGLDTLLSPGELALYPPMQWHMQYADAGVAPRLFTAAFSLEGGALEPLCGRKRVLPPQAVPLLQELLREEAQPDGYSGAVTLHLLSLLLLSLLRQAAAPEEAAAPRALGSEGMIIRRAQQYIHAHLRERLTVPEVARNTDVSASYLTALFRKHLQISPGEYIRRMKLEESKRLIREGSMNFTEIAQALEYSTVHHFSRQFKEKFGMTPTEYARSVRE